MAKLFMTEYGSLTQTSGAPIPVPQEPSAANQVVDFTSGVTQSAVFNGATKFVRLISDTDGYLAFGTNPTAVTGTSTLIKADQEYWFGVQPEHRLSVIS